MIDRQGAEPRTPEQNAAIEERFRQQLIGVLPAIRAFARGLCGRRDLADDLAQEAVLKAWQARNSFQPDTNFKAWIFMILRNHYFSERRKHARSVAWDPDVAERELVTAPSQEVSAELGDLRRAMKTLSAEQREALILVAAGGFAYEEAAAIAGCATGTIKSRVARARRTLEEAVKGKGGITGPRPSASESTYGILDELAALTPAASRPGGAA